MSAGYWNKIIINKGFTALLSLALSAHCEAHSTAAALSPAAAESFTDVVTAENKLKVWTLDPLPGVLQGNRKLQLHSLELNENHNE